MEMAAKSILRNILLRNHYLNMVAGTSGMNLMCRFTSRKTGRGSACEPLCKHDKILKLAKIKAFTREAVRELTVDDLTNSSRGFPASRRYTPIIMTERRRQILSSIFSEYITEIFATEERFAGLNLQIDRIEVNEYYSKLKLYWITKGDGSDQETEDILIDNVFFIEKLLAKRLYGAPVPPLRIVADRKVERNMEVYNLLNKIKSENAAQDDNLFRHYRPQKSKKFSNDVNNEENEDAISETDVSERDDPKHQH